MVIHSLRHGTEDQAKRLLEILEEHTRDQEKILEAIDIIKSTNSIEFASNTAKEMVKKSWDEVSAILPQNEHTEKLKLFVDYLVDRDT